MIRFFPLFFIGILLYKMKTKRFTISRVLLIIICFLIQLLMFKKKVDPNWGMISFLEYIIMMSIFLIISFLFLANKLRFIINRYTSKLGEISYSLYLIHSYIGSKTMYFLQTFFGLNLWFGMIIAIVMVIAIAYLINKYVEKPALLFIREKYRKKTIL